MGGANMLTKTIKVPVTLKTDDPIAREVAENVLMRANPHDSELVAKELEDAGINVESMTKYFKQIAAVVCEFWANQHDPNEPMSLKPHEIRTLYLPVMYAVIFASIGNIKIGSYEFLLTPTETDSVDRKFIFEMSANLESLRHRVKGDVGQIGNRAATPMATTMSAILYKVSDDKRNGTLMIRDGATFEEAAAGLAALAGLSVVNEAYLMLYTGVEEVNFREVAETIVDKGLRESQK
jgi:hypothetical protein